MDTIFHNGEAAAYNLILQFLGFAGGNRFNYELIRMLFRDFRLLETVLLYLFQDLSMNKCQCMHGLDRKSQRH